MTPEMIAQLHSDLKSANRLNLDLLNRLEAARRRIERLEGAELAIHQVLELTGESINILKIVRTDQTERGIVVWVECRHE